MSSDLYYSGLNVRNPQVLRNIVINNLWEVRQYLLHAERTMREREFSYSYIINSIIIKIDFFKNDGKMDLFTADSIFLDPDGQQKIKDINYIQRELTIPEVTSERCVFGLFDDTYVKYSYTVKEVILTNIEPLDVLEEEEDEALDLLFESSFVYNSASDERKGGKISIIGTNPKNRTIRLNSVPKNEFFWIHCNAYILTRQRRAIEELAIHPKIHMIPLLNLLQTWEYTKWETVKTVNPPKYFVLTDESKDGCNEQRKFVRLAMGTPDFAILEGPPGSGKTTTLLELIAQEVKRGKRILMVASTHVAVDNIIERIVSHQTDEEKKSLLNVCGIIPLRIGEEGNVSEEVRKYCLNKLVETEKERLISELKAIIKRGEQSKAQESLYEDLVNSNEKSDDFIRTLLLESANLICGTTIGVLQAPILQKTKSLEPVFDIVILDEASKTTFQEFLVPALYGKKWILSGDVKQLAPFVDRENVISNLKKLDGFGGQYGYLDKQICLAAFSVARNYNNPDRKAIRIGKLVLQDINNLQEYASRMNEQIKGLDELFQNKGVGQSSEISFTAVHKKPELLKEQLEIMGSNLLVISRYVLKDIHPYLPLNLETEEKIDSVYERRKRAYIGSSDYEKSSNDIQRWEDHIEWRISRLHELDKYDPKYEKLKFEIKMLLPYFHQEMGYMSDNKISRAEKIERDIHRIRRIALPSVLELLQRGFEVNENNTFARVKEIALYSGLSYDNIHREIYNSRHVLLSYQHRMHPHISAFPRENVYKGTALKDASGIADKRSWSYDYKYPSRNIWIDVKPESRNYSDKKTSYNLAEVDVVIKELQEFMKWAKENPSNNHDDGYWSVALLSFYKGQSKKISNYLLSIKEKYKLEGNFNDFSSREYNVTLKISTVDRFQGHEADIVFLSFVRARDSSIGFLDNINRLNVAITRARYQLVIVGDKKKFTKSRIPILNSLAKNVVEGPIHYRKRE